MGVSSSASDIWAKDFQRMDRETTLSSMSQRHHPIHAPPHWFTPSLVHIGDWFVINVGASVEKQSSNCLMASVTCNVQYSVMFDSSLAWDLSW